MPNSQVNRFHRIPPMRPGEDDRQPHSRVDRRQQLAGLAVLDVQHLRGDGGGDLDRQERTHEVQHTGEQNRHLWLQSAGGDRRRHRVARVVEPVREVEDECRRDEQHQDDQLCAHGAHSAAPRRDPPKKQVPRSACRSAGFPGPAWSSPIISSRVCGLLPGVVTRCKPPNRTTIDLCPGHGGGDAVNRFLSAIVSWLRAGYPDGMPPTDYMPVLALLTRRLTADEIRVVAAELIKRGEFRPHRHRRRDHADHRRAAVACGCGAGASATGRQGMAARRSTGQRGRRIAILRALDVPAGEDVLTCCRQSSACCPATARCGAAGAGRGRSRIGLC